MNKKIFISFIALATMFSATAQTTENQSKLNTYKTTWQKNRFKDNWFISIGSGAQILMAEDDSKADLKDRVTYAPSLSIGKYFSPIWGLRLNFTGGSLHGFNDGIAGTYRKWNSGSDTYAIENITWDPQWSYMGYGQPGKTNGVNNYTSDINFDGTSYSWAKGDKDLYMQHVHYFSGNINFMFDLITLFGNYNPRRVFDITPFAGVSVFHIFPNMGQIAYTGVGANGGLHAKFRLNDRFNFFLEGNATLYPDDFDGHAGDNIATDLVVQALGGFTVKFGKSNWEVCTPTDYNKIKDLNDQINIWRDKYYDLKNTPVPPCPPCPECKETPAPEKPVTFLPDPVFFRIDKSVIDPSEWSKIEKAAKYLNENPLANVVVTGYADKKTAYPEYNLKLSERRSKAVSKALIEKYGINPTRVSINWEGDKIQPFSINEWNRVVIFVVDK